MLDTCLFMVRAYLETDSQDEAARQARECRQLVPRVEPSAFRHTPEVRDLLAEVDADIAAEAPGVLEIDSAPTGCLARVNGVELGTTPLGGIELPPGTYRVQVECVPDTRGRIHRVAVMSGPNRFFVDSAFDEVVRTRPVLHLEYPTRNAWEARMQHAEVVADALAEAAPLVVTALPGHVVRLDSSPEHVEPASVWVRAPSGRPSSEDVRRAVDAILEGRSGAFTSSHPIAQASLEHSGRGRDSGGRRPRPTARRRISRPLRAPSPAAHRGLDAVRYGRREHRSKRWASRVARPVSLSPSG